MLTISKPLDSAQAKNYYREEYSNSEANYYSQEETIKGEWAGRLADELGLRGEIKPENFERLIDGCDPHTGDRLIRHVDERTVKNIYGEVITNKRHRAGYDATFSAPKSVSLAALVGNDARIRVAHRSAVEKALRELEGYTQARRGNVRPAVTTEKFIAATFEHDTARPDQDSGYAAPQLHTHAVVFNMTRLESGKWHALQPLELYRSQQYATAVYRTVLAAELQKIGYEIEVRSGAPEIKGFTPEYLEANSPRSAEVRRAAAEIKARLEAEGHTVKDGAGLRQAAATRRRSSKKFDPDEMRARHQELESTYGNQSHRAVEKALNGKGIEQSPDEVAKRAQESVTFARDHSMSREAVVDIRRFKTDALRRNLGLTTYDAVMDIISARRESGELIDIQGRNRPSQLTTQRMLELETGNIKTVLEGKGKQSPIVEIGRLDALIEEASLRQGIRLNGDQSQAVRGILTSEDRIVALQGRAGTGKTTTMQVLREVAERSGYAVRGITPTHKARKELEKSGLRSQTLHSFVLERKNAESSTGKRLFVLDESSLADTVRIERLFAQIDERDRILLVGDRTQHQAVEAGAPFEQFQKRGVTTIFLSENVRQKDPNYRRTVDRVSLGEIRDAVDDLKARGKIIEIADDRERMRAIAKEFVFKNSPTAETLVISPANKERVELNSLIHRQLQDEGRISRIDHHVVVLTNRQEMSGAERGFAGAYQPVNLKEGNTGDIIRYSRGSKKYGIDRGEYARVTSIDFKSNTITVRFEEGRELTYDPRRLQGVNVYREAKREFAEGDRIQFRASFEKAGKSGSQAVNGELGVIRKIEGSQFHIETESGRQVAVDVLKFGHLDHGYAVTSHSSQGQTVDRVIVNADTRESVGLLNRRMAYVALSRAREDGLIFTNSLTDLSSALDRRQDKAMALESWSNQTSYGRDSINREHSGSEMTRHIHHQEPQRQAEHAFDLGI